MANHEQRTALYVSVGRELSHYDVLIDSAELVRHAAIMSLIARAARRCRWGDRYYVSKYDIDVGDATMFWMGIVY